MYHNAEEAKNAEEEFDKIFIKKEVPDDIPEYKAKAAEMPLLDLIVEIEFAPSKGEARRLIQQGGVTLDGDKVTDTNMTIKFGKEQILKVGKRKFIKLL